MKDKIIAIFKVVISLGLMAYLFYWFLSDPERREVLLNHITTANYWYLLLALAFLIVAIVTNAIKWDILLRAQNIRVPLRALTNYTFVGQFFNNFLPANVGGDLMRGVGLAQYTERNAETAVSIIVDRIIGLLAFMFTAMVAALLAANIIPEGQSAEAKTLAQILKQIEVVTIVGMGLMIAGFAVILSHRLRQLVGKIFTIKLLSPLQPIYQHLSEAFGAYRYQYKALVWAFLVGVGTVLLTGLIDIAIVAGLHGELDPIYIFLFNPIIAIALIAPISIGGLGTGSLLYVGLYGLVGAAAPLVFALSLVKQVILYIGSLPGGVLWLQNRGRRKERQLDVVTTQS